MISIRKPAFVLLALTAMTSAVQAFKGDTVVLQGMDKVTARVWSFEAPVDRVVRFGTLEIIVRTCDRTPPEEPPESAAFLDIFEAKTGGDRHGLFHGWMFASSPGLNGLEHPVYDVWVLECKKTAKQDGGKTDKTDKTDKTEKAR
jgi:hypothetical protein